MGYLLHVLTSQALDVWFHERDIRMYDFLTFFRGLMVMTFSFAWLIPVKSFDHRFWKAGAIIAVLYSLAIWVTGMTFTVIEKTDEFEIYFTQIVTFDVFYAIGLVLFLRIVMFHARVSTRVKAVLIPLLLIPGGIFHPLIARYWGIGDISLAIIIITITILLLSTIIKTKI